MWMALYVWVKTSAEMIASARREVPLCTRTNNRYNSNVARKVSPLPIWISTHKAIDLQGVRIQIPFIVLISSRHSDSEAAEVGVDIGRGPRARLARSVQ